MARARRDGWAKLRTKTEIIAAKSEKMHAALEKMHAAPLCGRTPALPCVAEAVAQSVADEIREAGERTKLHLVRGVRRVAKHVGEMDPSAAFEQAQNIKATTAAALAVPWMGRRQARRQPPRVADIPQRSRGARRCRGSGS